MRSSSAPAIGAILVLAIAATALVLRGVEDSARPFAMGYIALEALASISALVLLKAKETRHVRSIELAANRGGRIVQMFEGAIDAVDSAYTTVANALAGAGLIGSATFLLVGASQPAASTTHLDALLVIAPKAFAATGFALCCSIVVSLRGQWPFLSWLRSWRDEIIQRQRLETVVGTADTVSLSREDLITDSIIQFTAAFQEMNTRNQRLFDAFDRQHTALDRHVTVLRENNVAQRTLLEKATNVLEPAVASLAALTTSLRPEIVDTVPTLHREIHLLTGEVKSNSVAVSRLVQTLGDEREGVMQAQADVLRDQTVALAREALGQLTIASGGVIRTHLEEIAKRVEQHAESVYERAYAHATERLARTLEYTSSSTRALADSLTEAAEKLVTVQLGVQGVVTALDAGAERTVESAARFRLVAEDIKRTLDAFATRQEDAGDKPTLIAEIEKMARQLHETASLIAEQWREVQAERSKLAGFRTRLVDIAQKRSSENANG